MLIGYARVSTDDQTLDLQRATPSTLENRADRTSGPKDEPADGEGTSVSRNSMSCCLTCDNAAATSPAGTATMPSPHIRMTNVKSLPASVTGYTSP